MDAFVEFALRPEMSVIATAVCAFVAGMWFDALLLSGPPK